MANRYQQSLRELQEAVDEVKRSIFSTFASNLQRFFDVVDNDPLISGLVASLPEQLYTNWKAQTWGEDGERAHSLSFPSERRARVAIQLRLVREILGNLIPLYSFSSAFFAVGSRLDDQIAAFVTHVFRPMSTDLIKLLHNTEEFEAGLNEKPEASEEESGLLLFISHSAKDALLARALITLLSRALHLTSESIRCTSVDGYKLTPGDESDAVIRKEILTAKVVIGLITPSSLDSAYVLFELGARWGAQKRQLPILAKGIDAGNISGPLKQLHAASLTNHAEIHDLLASIARFLKKPLEPPAVYSKEIDELLEANRIKDASQDRTHTT